LSQEEEFLLTLCAEVNNTLRNLDDGTFHFLVPGKWIIHSSNVYTFSVESEVRLRIPEQVSNLLRQFGDRGPQPCSKLIQDLERELKVPYRDAIGLFSRWREIGLIELQNPWVSNSPTLEWELLTHLKTLTPGRYGHIQEQLDKLCALEELCVNDLDHACDHVPAIARTLHAVWDSLLNTVSPERPVSYTPITSTIKHDSFVTGVGTPIGEIGYVPECSVREALASIRPLEFTTNIFWPGYDFQHTVAAIMAAKQSDRTEYPLTALLKETRSVWREFTSYDLAAREKPLLKEPFNPLNLGLIRDLHLLRIQVWNELQKAQRLNARGECELSTDSLWAISGRIPSIYRPVLPCGLFLQPTNQVMSTWVLNATTEGVGRVASRFVHIMPPDTSRAYMQHARNCGSWSEGSTNVSLLDVSSIFGEILNVHPILSRYVLEMPGERYELERERRLRIRDLCVRFNGVSTMPALTGPSQERLLPVHLGAAGHDFVSSSTIRQICMLGPSRQSPYIPDGFISEFHGSSRHSRVVLGNLVLRRERWRVQRQEFPAVSTTGQDPNFYLAFHEWRLRNRVPMRAFVRLEIEFDPLSGRHKPQYLDFSSPLFMRLFASMIQNHRGAVQIEEMLPNQASFNSSREGGRVFEVFIDPLFFRG
jgi:hypothetical protein